MSSALLPPNPARSVDSDATHANAQASAPVRTAKSDAPSLVDRGDSTPKDDANANSPFVHGFWDDDAGTAHARKGWLLTSLGGVALITFVIWGILPIYWAALGRSSSNIVNLTGYVVDFDGSAIGAAVVQAFSSVHGQEEMSWLVVGAAQFPDGPASVQAALLDERCWAAVVVSPDATAALNEATSVADAGFNTSLAVTAYITSARNEHIYESVIIPQVDIILSNVSDTFSTNRATQLATRSGLATLLGTAPDLVTRPLGYIFVDLRPFDIPVAAAVDFVGLIYLLILAFMLTNILLSAREQTGFARRLAILPLILMRILWPVVLYFFISLMYSLLSLAFGVPFDRYYGAAGFVIYWMMSWCGMMALGLAMEAMIVVLTVRFVPIFLVLWIITNVSVAFYPIEVLPAVFRYGYAMPFYNVSRTVRTLVFGTKNQMGLNFGVQLAWVVVSCTTIPIFQWYARRHEVRAWERSNTELQSKI